MTEPLTPTDCDLRGMPFMPLDVARFIDSDLFAISTGEEFKAAFALLCKSWHQVPAASLPDDDRILAHLSGAGARWGKIKATALRNWIKCDDGRLYHPVVAEKAIEALPMRQEYRDRKSSEAERKAREREDRKRMFDQLRAVGVVPNFSSKTSELRELVAQHATDNVTPVTDNVTDDVTPVTRTVTAKTEKETEKERDVSSYGQVAQATCPTHNSSSSRALSPERATMPPADPTLDRVRLAAGMSQPPRDARRLQTWLQAGADLEHDILPVVERTTARLSQRGDKPQSFKLFEDDVMTAARNRQAEGDAELRKYREITERYAHLPRTEIHP